MEKLMQLVVFGSAVACARGPGNCEKCLELSIKKRIHLVHFYIDDGTMARPVREIIRDDIRQWFAYDIVREFESKEDALDNVKTHSISSRPI
jgi:hypothetical protein